MLKCFYRCTPRAADEPAQAGVAKKRLRTASVCAAVGDAIDPSSMKQGIGKAGNQLYELGLSVCRRLLEQVLQVRLYRRF